MNYLKPGWREGKKNSLTFIIGATIHLFIFILLQYFATSTHNKFLELIYRFYVGFVLIDAVTMAILYKCYWGRTILNEIGPEDNWEYDKDNHYYNRKPPVDPNTTEKEAVNIDSSNNLDMKQYDDNQYESEFIDPNEPNIPSEFDNVEINEDNAVLSDDNGDRHTL